MPEIKTTFMGEIAKPRPARKFGPGYFIREQMEYRNWTQEDLAEVTGITIKHLNRILKDKQPVTLEMAKIFAGVFDTSPQYWINLDANYRLWLAGEKSIKEMDADLRAKIYERMPVKDMLTKGWILPFANAQELAAQVTAFWGWVKLDFSLLDNQYLPFLPRKSEAFNQFNASYAITWYRKAIVVAEQFPLPNYDKGKLQQLFDALHLYTIETDGISNFIRDLSEAGVLFFVLPHLQKTYLDGAAFFSGNNPAIVYTARYRRIDNFWFTVAHEIAHILLHLNEEMPFILDNLKEDATSEMETEANNLAAEKLKHPQILQYLESYTHYLTNQKVEECSAEYRIHPAIVIGKLAHDKKISYSNQGLYNEDVLQLIPERYKV